MTYQEVIALVMPARNAEQTIEAAIKSALGQTVPLRLVIVDDGSTDATADIVARIAKSDPNITLISGPSRGVSTARNTGLDYALESLSPTLIGFMDSDDTLSSEHIQRMLEAMVGAQADVVTLSHPNYSVGAPPKGAGPHNSSSYISQLIRLKRPTSVWAYLFRAHLLTDHRFDPEIRIFEDLEFLVRTLGGHPKISFCASEGYHYGIQEGSVNNRPIDDAWISSTVAYAKLKAELGKNEVASLGLHLAWHLTHLLAAAPKETQDTYRERVHGLAREVCLSPITAERSVVRRVVVLLFSLSPRPVTHSLALARRLRKKQAR